MGSLSQTALLTFFTVVLWLVACQVNSSGKYIEYKTKLIQHCFANNKLLQVLL